MCGIVGICGLGSGREVELTTLQRMMGVLRHRGPDESGVYLDDVAGLGHVRLSIIDLASGCQPIHNEDQTLWIVYNGEIFNYLELRRELEQQGHSFYTTTDTEVIVHLYEQEGPACLKRLNGQFALAIWNRRDRELFLARDRAGIRPLHYTVQGGRLIFSSEIKAIFTVPGIRREIDPLSLDQVFTFWTVLPGRTLFRDIHELPPGHYLKVSGDALAMGKYWDIPLYTRDEQLRLAPRDICEGIRELLLDAVRIRLRADVPVGGYLSGGLDSSGVAAMVVNRFNPNLQTYGIRFDQPSFDEGEHQERMVSVLGTRHREVRATPEQIGGTFAQTLWHCEKPLLRTAPVPLHLLSGAVRESGIKVVLTGEGADEVFGGYNIFKEAKVRQFWSKRPDSALRSALLGHLYGYVFHDQRARPFLRSFFARGLDRLDDPFYSHLLRWENTSRLKTFFSDDFRARTRPEHSLEQMRAGLPDQYHHLDVVAKAQYLEMTVFLSNYLLSSQGDRVAMANSVEIRLPFLDYRVIDFAARIPSRWKILGLREKHILRRALEPFLPADICARQKQPYRAPIVSCLLSRRSRETAAEMLEAGAIRRAGLFNATKVEKLLAKMQMSTNPGEIDSMALAGILSSQIVHHQFVERFAPACSPVIHPKLLVDKRMRVRSGIPA